MATGGHKDMDIFHNQLEMCSTCKIKSKNKASYTFFVDCDDYFCSNCVEAHKQTHLCKDHTDLKKTEVDSGKRDGQPIEYAKFHDKNNLHSFKRGHKFPLKPLKDRSTKPLPLSHDKQKFNKTVSKRNSKSDQRLDGETHTLMSEGDHSDMVTKNYLNFYSGHLFHDKRRTSICVNLKSDANVCNIVSSCFMEDGTLILADNNNYKLKRLDGNTYQVIDYCDISKDPRQLCYISESQVAVTLGSEKAVRFISIENEMTTAKQFKTTFDCYGITCADSYLYISSMKSIYIYTLSGQELQQISKCRLGMTIFSDISSVSISKDTSRIYIADYFNGLIVLSNDRRVIKRFGDEQLQEANCCYITDAGSVLVSGEKSNNVLLFTRNGKLIGEVVKSDNEKEPVQSVCCNQQMSKVCIARLYENNIEIYTFTE